jgi:hypothetical protein
VGTMKHRRSVLGLVAVLGLASFAFAPAGRAEGVVMSGEASRNAHVVNKGVKWHTSLEEAQTQAKKDGKLVFWLHMLGTMDGAT